MNNFTHAQFGLFETEQFHVNFIRLNIESDVSESTVNYLQRNGFNVYEKQYTDNNKKNFTLTDLNEKNSVYNPFLVYFISDQPLVLQLEVCEQSARHFYNLIISNNLNWDKLLNPRLSRFDLVYQRDSKVDDRISNIKFLKSSYHEIGGHYAQSLTNTSTGIIVEVRDGKSKNYRIFADWAETMLKFEAEIKDHMLCDAQDLFVTSPFDQELFETKLVDEFFKLSSEVFEPIAQASNKQHLDWLMPDTKLYFE